MKRTIRKSLPFFSLVLVLLAGVYLALPHDVCISKVVATTACECAPKDDGACCCCGPVPNVMSCGDHAAGTASTDSSSESSACFSISSDLSHMTGAERANNPAPVMAVVAILPLPTVVSVGSAVASVDADQCTVIPDQLHLHRDNCVFLI